MESDPRFREFIVGIEGLALLRNAVDGDEGFRSARLEEIRRFSAEADDDALAAASAVPELDVRSAYDSWAATYDGLPNALIEAEEPVVHAMIDRAPAGDALDAACGTGRHALALVARGHRTIGVDQSARMLAVARDKVPDGEFRVGHLEQLPLDDACVDLAVCGLALTHLPDISRATAELARVTRPGGTVIISDAHPMPALLQSKLLVADAAGDLGFVRWHVHLLSGCFAVFASCGLRVRSCEEPLFNGLLPPGGFEESIAEAAQAAWGGMPWAIVWELEVSP